MLLDTIESYPTNLKIKKLIINVLKMGENVIPSKVQGKIETFTNLSIARLLEKKLKHIEFVSVLALESPKNSDLVLNSGVWSIVKEVTSAQEDYYPMKVKFIKNLVTNKKFVQQAISESLQDQIFDDLVSICKKSETLDTNSLNNITRLTDILGTFAVATEDLSQKIAAKLISALKDGSSSNFYQKVFIPLLVTTPKISVCLKPDVEDDESSQQKICTEEVKAEKLVTKYVPDEHRTLFNKNLEELVDPLCKKLIMEGNWKKQHTVLTDGTEFVNGFRQKVCGQPGAVLILIDGQSTGQTFTLGIFSHKNFAKIPEANTSGEIQTESTTNNFIFLLERTASENSPEGKKYGHYYKLTDGSFYLKLHYGSGEDSGLMVFVENNEKIFLSSVLQSGTHIDLYPMKVLPSSEKPEFEFPYDFQVMSGFEVWTVDFLDKSQDDSVSNVVNFALNQKPEEISQIDSNFSLWSKSSEKFYEIPTCVNLNKLTGNALASKTLKKADDSSPEKTAPTLQINGVAETEYSKPLSSFTKDLEAQFIDLTFKGEEFKPKKLTYAQLVENTELDQPVFQEFLKQSGFASLIERIKETLNDPKKAIPMKEDFLQII